MHEYPAVKVIRRENDAGFKMDNEEYKMDMTTSFWTIFKTYWTGHLKQDKKV
jgi:hypothetical protein